jgi:hypothetical protein
MSEAGSDAHERKHPPEASILAAAKEESHRHYFAHGDGVFSTPATDVQQALEFALDEFPSDDRSDFELITDFCQHGRPRHEKAWGCYQCRYDEEMRRRDGLDWLFIRGENR